MKIEIVSDLLLKKLSIFKQLPGRFKKRSLDDNEVRQLIERMYIYTTYGKKQLTDDKLTRKDISDLKGCRLYCKVEHGIYGALSENIAYVFEVGDFDYCNQFEFHLKSLVPFEAEINVRCNFEDCDDEHEPIYKSFMHITEPNSKDVELWIGSGYYFDEYDVTCSSNFGCAVLYVVDGVCTLVSRSIIRFNLEKSEYVVDFICTRNDDDGVLGFIITNENIYLPEPITCVNGVKKAKLVPGDKYLNRNDFIEKYQCFKITKRNKTQQWHDVTYNTLFVY